ncbi:MAG: hypothetical protein SFU86_22310, partial [Pirellulaceae bacterium]|nr:hypothetical protein [Pirellulaceae bacterium]
VALILSLQTDLLDSQPITTVETLVRNANFFHIDNLNDPRATPVMPPATPDNVTAIGPHSLWLARNSTQGITYAELVHPADLVATELDSSDTTTGWRRVRTKIFPERLEKGVIRRARLCGWFLPSENDEQVAARVARQYLGEPLPLTT